MDLELDSEIPSTKLSYRRKKIAEYVVDETLVKVGSEFILLWVAIEPVNRQILALNTSKERNMLIAERFIADLVRIHGKPLYQRMVELGIHKLVDF